MICSIHRNLTALAIAIGCLAAAAHADLLIDFDGTGYSSAGTDAAVGGATGAGIDGQGPTPKWYDYSATSSFVVVENAGRGGDNNGMLTAVAQASSSTTYYTASLGQLGAAAFSTDSALNFAVDVNLYSTDSPTTALLYRIGIGQITSSKIAIQLCVYGNGDIQVWSNNSPTGLTLPGAVTIGSGYHTVSGSINYQTDTAAIMLEGSSTVHNIDLGGGYDSYGAFAINIRSEAVNSTAGMALDNINLGVSAVPEPASILLLTVGVGVLTVRPGRRQS